MDILVIADRDADESRAIARAAELARKLGDHLHIVSFAYEPLVDMGDMVSHDVAEKVRSGAVQLREQALQAHVTKCCEGVPVKTTAVWAKSVADWVIEHVKQVNYRYVIKTAAHTSTLFYTSTDWRLMRECAAPVMILAAKKWKKRNRILATIDVSKRGKTPDALNRKVLDTARMLASHLNGEVHVAYVVPLPKVLLDLDLVDAAEYRRKAKAKAELALQQICSECVDEEHFQIAFGEPERKIPSIANSLKADLVIMGSQGRKGVKGKFLGNTAEKTLNRLYTDILTVRA